MAQSLKGIKANAIVSATSSITTSTSVGGNLLPTGNVTYDIGSSTARWKDLYLSNNTIFLGNTAVSANSILPINLDIAPEVLTIQVAAPDAGDDTTWLWTWETSTLPYARTSITNSPQINVPLYKQGTYTINNFAANEMFGNMTQTHDGYFKWVDGAGTQNLVSWAVDNGNANVTHPDINGGVSTSVQRYTVTVPSNITLPTLVAPTASYNVSFVSAGAYTIGGDAEGNNKNIGPLYRGSTYTFNLASSIASHPFYLTTDNGTGFVANTYVGEYTNGVTGSRNNGSSGQTTLVFTVPNNAPDTLYYQCGVHSSMRGTITIKDLAVETNINGNYVIYFQHTHEGHKTPIEIRPIPSLVNQMCVVYDASVGKFVPQDLATYVENTPSFRNKIREVAGTATLIAPNGVAVVPTVLVVEDVSYLPLINNKEGDIAFDSYYDTIYVWQGNAWRNSKATTISSLPGANITGQVGNALVASTVYTSAQPNITSVGTLTGLTSNGIVNLTNTSNVSLGAIGNIKITGGSANYIMKTDGAGNLSWAAQTGGTQTYVKTYFWEGVLQENVSTKRFYIHVASTLEKITVNLGTAGQTQSTIRINRNGQVINSIVIAANTVYLVQEVSHQLALNDYLSVDVTQSSSAVNLYVTFVYRE